jgi:TetR/AcrR family transcriptional regulator, cholesterol catabolism regulator
MTDLTAATSADTNVAAAGTSATGEEGNRRGDILRAAGRLFRQKGYNGTTIRDIADAVGMRSGSPFYHFKSKHEILFRVTTEGIEVMLRNLEATLADQLAPRECFEACVTTHLNYLLGPGRDFAWVMLYESRLLDPAERDVVHRMSARYEEVFSGVLDRLQANGDLDDSSVIARKLILGAMNWSAQWYNQAGGSDPSAIAQQFCKLFLRAKP